MRSGADFSVYEAPAWEPARCGSYRVSAPFRGFHSQPGRLWPGFNDMGRFPAAPYPPQPTSSSMAKVFAGALFSQGR